MDLINKKANFDYEIVEKYEAGIVLNGLEVKAIRRNAVDFSGSHVTIFENEAYVINLHIGTSEEDTRKRRKLLLNKAEILRLNQKKESSGLTIIPLKLYNAGAKFKLEIALARGKKLKHKREVIKKRDIDRDTEREMKEFR